MKCGRSIETTRRSALADAADYGYCANHSRFFWGFRLHGLFALDCTPRALALTSAKRPERDVALDLLARTARNGPLTVVGDKGYTGRDFKARAAELDALIVRPRRKDGPAGALTSPQSANASSRSFRPRSTCSASKATARANCTLCAPASPQSSSR